MYSDGGVSERVAHRVCITQNINMYSDGGVSEPCPRRSPPGQYINMYSDGGVSELRSDSGFSL